jgi:hypothetical protein
VKPDDQPVVFGVSEHGLDHLHASSVKAVPVLGG